MADDWIERDEPRARVADHEYVPINERWEGGPAPDPICLAEWPLRSEAMPEAMLAFLDSRRSSSKSLTNVTVGSLWADDGCPHSPPL